LYRKASARQSKARRCKKGLKRAEALQPQSKAAEKFAEKNWKRFYSANTKLKL